MSADNSQTFDFDKPTERKRGVGRGSRFFVLDRLYWEVACGAQTNNRLNLLTTLLVLLAGTGADHLLSKWSTKACEQYAGMGKPRAKLAIQEMLKARLISHSPASTPRFPQYKFPPPRKGVEPGFLPVQLITGCNGETPILRRIRDTGDEVLLRMLIDLYGRTQLDAPHGMPLSVLRKEDNSSEACRKVTEAGAHVVWSLARGTSICAGSWRSPYEKDDVHEHFWPKIFLLEQLGALLFEDWVFSSDSIDAEPLFPVLASDPSGGIISLSDRAAVASRLLTADRPYLLSPHQDKILVVLPAHHRAPAVRGVAKLRVEADTPGRRAAFGTRQGAIRHWHGEYERLCADLKIGCTDRPIRTSQPAMAD